MTPELAAYLDGEVAARWGRPTMDGGWTLLRNHANKWNWSVSPDRIEWSLPRMPEEAEALWVSHLLRACGERGWSAMLNPTGAGFVVTIREYGSVHAEPTIGEAHMPTMLESLARAMMQVAGEVKA